MESVGDVLTYNFDEIPIDPFWNVGDEEEHKMHRIHAYPAKFPAFITTKAIQYSEKLGIELNYIADIFCGCGTTSYEARRNSIDFWGCDINPVATLIAEVKSKNYKDETLTKYFDSIIDHFNSLDYPDFDISFVNERIRYWFNDDKIIDLTCLIDSIEYVIPARSHYKKFFLCAFSNILKKSSKWLSKSIKPQIDPEKKPRDVITLFTEQFKFMREANIESELSKESKVTIKNINFLERDFYKPFVDLLITSPPYITSYEYADLHQLSTLWLRYTEDFRNLRNGTIGSLYRDSDFIQDAKNLNKTGDKIVFQLYNVHKRKARAAARYYLDIQKSIEKSYKILNNNGMALFVIGNTEFKGVRMDNVKHLTESMINAGYSDLNVTRRKISNKNLTPYRDEIGRFTIDKNSREIYSEEFIVTGRKYGN